MHTAKHAYKNDLLLVDVGVAIHNNIQSSSILVHVITCRKNEKQMYPVLETQHTIRSTSYIAWWKRLKGKFGQNIIKSEKYGFI